MRKYLTEEEIRALLHAPKNFRDHLLLRLLYLSGMRVGEMAQLKVKDVELNEDHIIINVERAKQHKEGRKVVIYDPPTYRMLQYYLNGKKREDPLFRSNKGNPLSKRQMQEIYWKCAKKIGLDRDKQHIHCLRHTYAVMSLKQGLPLPYLQQQLGHSDMKSTAEYLKLVVEDRVEALKKISLPL
jgi:integrase/recombinase XerD